MWLIRIIPFYLFFFYCFYFVQSRYHPSIVLARPTSRWEREIRSA
jgi:hypothetical protein